MQEANSPQRVPESVRPSYEQLANALRELFRAERDVAQAESRKKPIMPFTDRQKIYLRKSERTSAMQQARVLLRDLDGSEA